MPVPWLRPYPLRRGAIIEHWAAGGETSLENLMLLCWKHHSLVHEGGFTIEQDYRRRWFFRRADGRAVPACGYRAADMTDDDVWTRERVLYAHASAEVRPSAEAWMVREPSAEVQGESSRRAAIALTLARDSHRRRGW